MRWIPVLLASFLMAFLPTSSAETADACNEPCGFIVPLIDLDFPDKMLCGGGRFIYAEETPDDCTDVPMAGESWSIDGTFRMWWDAQEEPTYPILPDEPILVTFSGTASNPAWLDISVEPASFELTTADLYTAEHYDIDQDRTPILLFSYERDITVTFTRVGDPDARWDTKLEDRHGVTPNFLKARSTASGDYYREAFGVEEFRFNACTDPAIADVSCGGQTLVTEGGAERVDETTPTLAPLALLAALVGVAAMRRRR